MRKAPSIHICILIAFLANMLGPVPLAQAQEFRLPAPGVMVHLSPPLEPPILKGIKVHPDNPFRFDFILDQGDSSVIPAQAGPHTGHSQELGIQSQEQLKNEATRLIKYFLASLTIPEKDLWVNLSPYEKDRIIPQSFGLTEMGRDLLAEDYMLKQITASLIYPEGETGKKFWKRVYSQAAKKYGTTNIPVNTFNKVWIVPEKAVVYENAKAGTAYVVESTLKVMLEQDYLSMSKHADVGGLSSGFPSVLAKACARWGCPSLGHPNMNGIGSQIVREIVIPELTKEVNEDKNFAQLRQVYNSLILATWYKKRIKDSILEQVYADKNKVAGVGYKKFLSSPNENSLSSPNALIGDPEYIYQQYLKAFKKGVYNFIKEEPDPVTQEMIPRKYFSGGVKFGDLAMVTTADSAMLPPAMAGAEAVEVRIRPEDRAMTVEQITEDVDRLISKAPPLKSLKDWPLQEHQAKIIAWLQSQDLLPQAALFRTLLQNIIALYMGGSKKDGSKDIVEGWLKILSQKWQIPEETLQTLMRWLARNKIIPKDVPDENFLEFFKSYVESYREYPNLRKTFVYNLPPGLFSDQKLILAGGNIQRMINISSTDFVSNHAELKAPIEGSKYFIGIQYGVAESTYGLYLALGIERNAHDPLEGVFLRIGLDTQGNALRVNMIQGVQGRQKDINAFKDEFGLHPGVALLYVAEQLAAQGHLQYNRHGFDPIKKPFQQLMGIRPEFIPTMRNGKPSINLMINYERFGLRQSTEFARWQSVAYLEDELIPNRLSSKDIKDQRKIATIRKMTVAFDNLKPIPVHAVDDGDIRPANLPRRVEKDEAMTTAQKNEGRQIFLKGGRERVLGAAKGRHFTDTEELNYNTMTAFLNYLNGTVGTITFAKIKPDGKKVLAALLTGEDAVLEYFPGSSRLVRLKRNLGDIDRPSIIEAPEYNNIWNTLQPTNESLLRVLHGIAATQYNSIVFPNVVRPVRNLTQIQQDRKRKAITVVINDINILFEKEGMEYSLNPTAPRPETMKPAPPVRESPVKKSPAKSNQLSLFPKDQAMKARGESKTGGIDLTPANMKLQTQNAGAGIKFRLDPAMLKQLQNAPGFVPVIINIQPMTDLRVFLGLKNKKIYDHVLSL